MKLLKKVSKKTLLIAGCIGLAFFLVLVFYFIQQKNRHIQRDSTSSANMIITDEKENADSGLPVRLKIPSIEVDAPVEYVGIIANGEMGIPKGPADVGWYEIGPRPGENGSAVIAGHYGGWKNGEKSVFDDLNKLKEGDSVYIENENGGAITFIVQKVQTFNPNDDASAVFVSSDGKAHLNLITCEGAWNKNSRSYSKRLVVFADRKIE